MLFRPLRRGLAVSREYASRAGRWHRPGQTRCPSHLAGDLVQVMGHEGQSGLAASLLVAAVLVVIRWKPAACWTVERPLVLASCAPSAAAGRRSAPTRSGASRPKP
jgi:hypothetical protein